MQTSGGMRREIAKSYSIVIVREGGRSSIPETAVMNREAAAYWMPRLRGA
jgi:hypothetical protein